MRLFILLLVAFETILIGKVTQKEIANMFILGFYGTKATKSSQIYNDICKRGLGGVIVFQKSPVKKGAAKNFTDAKSLKTLTKELKSCGTKPLIAVDQEGGLVQRIKLNKIYPKPSMVAKVGIDYANNIYNQMAQELYYLGINLNFAPVADIAINPKNRVIVKWGRSYGKDAKSVIAFDRVFIKAMHNFNIATSLKHFPGHGSSFGDTHKGFVDVTSMWQLKELKPYFALKNITDTVMVAHIFNKKLDPNYPASLSAKTIKGKLRREIGFRGVVISDDLQMGAIAKHYSLKQRVKLSINAGVDIMLFANQVAPSRVIKVDKLIKIVKELLKEKQIDERAIKSANIRINSLKQRLY